jgi:hypothetical protein
MTTGVNRATRPAAGWLDLSKEPQNLPAPEMAGRGCSGQFTGPATTTIGLKHGLAARQADPGRVG